MMKNKNLFLVASFLLLAMDALSLETQVTNVGQSSKTLPVKDSSLATDGTYNFRTFEVDAPEAGRYYTEFWLLPAKYTNNVFTTFLVYLNDKYVGSITPDFGNWQAARVNGYETLYLSEGRNIVTVATLAPEFPAVETIKVAKNNADAVIASDAYDSFLEDSTAGLSYFVPQEAEMSVFSNNYDNTNRTSQELPLIYTFVKTIELTKGQEFVVTSSSDVSHKIDVIFYGTSSGFIINNHVKGLSENQIQDGKGIDGIVIGGGKDTIPGEPIKYVDPYTPANSDEMQGLNWVFPSEKAVNSSKQIATGIISVPKTGLYLIRVRHIESGCTSIADVNINNAYYYDNIPISLASFDYTIPVDGREYAIMTSCDNSVKDDPLLYIHGNAFDRVVGYNDDGHKTDIEKNNLSQWDSYISQTYKIKTTGISVSNYSSSNPKSNCHIIIYPLDDSTLPRAKSKGYDGNASEVSEIASSNNSIEISTPNDINGHISITSKDIIESVSIYGLAGNCVYSVNLNNTNFFQPLSVLNIAQASIYVIRVETVNGIVSQKFAVR